MTQKAVSLVSGGMDSLVALALALEENREVYTLHMSYGQRTMHKEKECFERICNHYHIPTHHRIMFDHTVLGNMGGSSLTDQQMEVSQADLSAIHVPTSYVPFRNAHMLCVAVSWAEVCGASRIYIGAVEEDSSGYPDCRESYYNIFNQLIAEGTKPETKITIVTPVIHMKKRDIVLKGTGLQAPFYLTWSCYKNVEIPCQNCDSCALRERGFREAGISDPLLLKIESNIKNKEGDYYED